MATGIETTPSIELTVSASTNEAAWLQYECEEYRARKGQWLFTLDHYTGEVVHPQKVAQYLRKRSLGESVLAFTERCDTSDYTNHLAAVIDGIAGMLFAVEGSANRVLNKVEEKDGQSTVTEVLGSTTDPRSTMGRLFLDGNGQGDGYLSLWKTLAIDLMLFQVGWVLVDGGVNGNPTIKIFPAMSVPNYLYDADGLAAVRVEEVVDGRTSIKQDPSISRVVRHVIFERHGWERWEVRDGKPKLLASGEYTFYDRNGMRCLPIFPVRLPLRRNVGWQLAVKANRMFNGESMRDHLLRLAQGPKLNIVAGDQLYDKIIDALEQGSNALQNDPNHSKTHDYIAPSAEPAKIQSEVLKRKVEEFWVTAFRDYSDAAQEKTATEAKQDVSAGVGAFLQLLKTAIDTAENNALWRIEQILYPNKKNMHFVCHVERADDFLPANIDEAIEKIRDRYFGKGGMVPVGRSTMISAIKTIIGWDGLEMSNSEIEAAVDAHIMAKGFKDVNGAAELPAEILVQHMLRIMQASGVIRAEEAEVADVAGMAKKLRTQIEAAAEARNEKPAQRHTYSTNATSKAAVDA